MKKALFVLLVPFVAVAAQAAEPAAPVPARRVFLREQADARFDAGRRPELADLLGSWKLVGQIERGPEGRQDPAGLRMGASEPARLVIAPAPGVSPQRAEARLEDVRGGPDRAPAAVTLSRTSAGFERRQSETFTEGDGRTELHSARYENGYECRLSEGHLLCRVARRAEVDGAEDANQTYGAYEEYARVEPAAAAPAAKRYY